MRQAFSEEDLTRYLQLSLDLFRDLQFSLQPRFHLEIGLLKMVQAGKLVAIEEALAICGAGNPGTVPPAPVKPTSTSRCAGVCAATAKSCRTAAAASAGSAAVRRSAISAMMTGARNCRAQ